MSQKSIILIVTLFILIVVGMFVYAHLKSTELQTGEESKTADVTEPVADPYADITRVDAKHYYINGKHTLVGEINLPTPCDLLEADATVMESYPEQIRVDFKVINNSRDCAPVVTAARFKVEATASENATWSALFMGRLIELNLIPAGPGEVPEDYELFIKG